MGCVEKNMQPPLLGLLPSWTLTNGGAITLLPWPWTPLWWDKPLSSVASPV